MSETKKPNRNEIISKILLYDPDTKLNEFSF